MPRNAKLLRRIMEPDLKIIDQSTYVKAERLLCKKCHKDLSEMEVQEIVMHIKAHKER